MTNSQDMIRAEIEWQVAHEGHMESVESVRRLAYRVLTVLGIELRLGIVDDVEGMIKEFNPSLDDDEDSFAEDPDYDPDYDRYGVRVPECPPLTPDEEEELVVRYPDISQ